MGRLLELSGLTGESFPLLSCTVLMLPNCLRLAACGSGTPLVDRYATLDVWSVVTDEEAAAEDAAAAAADAAMASTATPAVMTAVAAGGGEGVAAGKAVGAAAGVTTGAVATPLLGGVGAAAEPGGRPVPQTRHGGVTPRASWVTHQVVGEGILPAVRHDMMDFLLRK